MKKFNHLRVSRQWYQYWEKIPGGYTIAENLIDWVSQVDKMVDNINDWNKYLDIFVDQFDSDLQKTLSKLLSDWQEDGTLEIIINEALQTQMDDLKRQTNESIAGFDNRLVDTRLRVAKLEIQSDEEKQKLGRWTIQENGAGDLEFIVR